MDPFEDDFGDLYAEVEVQATSAINAISFPASLSAKVEEGEIADDKTSELSPDHKSDSASDLNKLDEPACIGDLEADCSDSDDDLNIVLNDEDCQRVLGGRKDGITHFEDDDEEFVTKEVTEGGRSGLGVSKQGVNGYGGDKGFEDGYNLYTQYKHARLHGVAFPSNTKVTDIVRLASGFSMPSSGDWEANGYNQQKSLLLSHASDTCTATNLVGPQCRYGFSLPWYRTILDVNIDAFEQKPWRNPGVDITDYFNFDFNEDSWKQYHSSLACSHYKQKNVDQENEGGVGPSASFDDSKERQANLPKGWAISVRGSSGERQPSMDVRHPRDLDSDVVIQIPLQDSEGDSYGSGKEHVGNTNGSVHEASEYVEPNVDDNRDIHYSGRADQLLESLEGNMQSSGGCFPLKRSSKPMTGFDQMSVDTDSHRTDVDDNADGYSHENFDSHASEGIEEDIEGVKIRKGEVGGKTCRSDPCTTETDLSPDDQSHFSPTSSSVSGDSEASKDSVRGDLEEPGSPLRMPSLNSNSELLDSVTSSHKNNISNGTKSKPYYSKKYSRHRSPFREKQKWHIQGVNGHAKRNKYLDSDEDAFLMSDAEFLHLRDYSSVDYSRSMERLTDFCPYDREVFLHDKLTNSSRGHGSRFIDGYSQTFDAKYPRRKVHQNVRGRMDRHVRKYWDEKEDYHERSIAEDAENRDRNWYHGRRGLSAESKLYRMYGTSRELVSRHSSAFNERETQCRSGKLSERKRTEFRHCLLEYKHEDYLMPEKYGARILLAEERRDALDKRYKTFTPSVEREVNISGQRGRYAEDSSLDLNGSWCREIGDERCGHQDHQSLSSWFHQKPRRNIRGTWHDTMSSRNETDAYGRCRRDTLDEDGSPFGNFNEVTDSEVRTIYPDDNVNGVERKYSWRSKTLHSDDDKSIRHGYNEVHAEEPFYSHENSLAGERFSDRCRYADDRILKLERPRRKMICEGSSADSVNRHSIISYRKSEQEQTVLKCRESVGLIVGEGKSGRYSDRRSLIYNGRLGKKVTKSSKELTASMDFYECRSGKTVQTDAAETVIKQRKDQLRGVFPIPEPRADMDIEEGQIIMEQNTEDHYMEKHDTKYAARTENMKKRTVRDENAFDSSKDVRGYDNQHILDTLAKMEKRRERFKTSVPPKKEPEKPSEPQSELVGTAEIRQQRPARKRRWA